MNKLTLALGLALTLPQVTYADTPQEKLIRYFETEIQTWISDPVLVAAVATQNRTTARYDQAQIDEMDQLWRAYAGIPEAEIIADVVENPAADFLRAQVAAANGSITEAFLMDARGLNVAASQPTSDYWQGDEAKFTETFPVGPKAIHLGDVELDESTQMVQSQISVTIVDGQTGAPIGALTVGVNLTSLM